MTSFTLRQHKRYRAEIKMGSGGGMVPNSMIAKNIQAFGFTDVSVVGSGRNRIAKGTWVHDDLRVRITTTKSEINRSKPEEFPLAALLQGIGYAEELRQPKKIPSKGSNRKRKTRRKKPCHHCHMASFTVRQNRRYRAEIRLGVLEVIAPNAKIAEELQKLGFVDVTVSGASWDRVAEGTWPLTDSTTEAPDRIKSIEEIG